MKIFLDANIIISILNSEYPLFTYTSRLLSLHGNKYYFYTSSVCLAIAYYYVEKKYSSKSANAKIAEISGFIGITACSQKEVALTVANKKIKDFEDGLEYYSALNEKCTVIITEDVHDFYFSEIEILKAEDFLKKYYLKS